MLAGKMKLRNFLVLVVLVGGGAITASYMACNKTSEPAKAQVAVVVPPPAPDAAVAVQPVAAPPPAPVPKSDLLPRPYDAIVMAWHEKKLDAGKGKDVSKGQPYKINVYQDAGQPKVNRAKVDANRNNKFDDKITFKAGETILEHAPADDENYTEKYRWNGAGWMKQP